MKTYNIIIKGRVQGVFFRENARKKAIALGVRGTARNLPGGDVEIFAQSAEANILAFVQWCRLGPENSKVEEIKVRKTDVQEYIGFEIIH